MFLSMYFNWPILVIEDSQADLGPASGLYRNKDLGLGEIASCSHTNVKLLYFWGVN